MLAGKFLDLPVYEVLKTDSGTYLARFHSY